MEWTIRKIKLELKYLWKISRNTSEYKENFIIEFKHENVTGIGETAPNIRYQETTGVIEQTFSQFCQEAGKINPHITELTLLLERLKLPNALRFGIESAFIHWYCKRYNISLFDYLGIQKPEGVESCYTLPIMDPSEVKEFVTRHNLTRFRFLKVKVNEEAAIDMISELTKTSKALILVDANEAWNDVEHLIRFLPRLKHFPVEFIEQPLPSSMEEEYIYLKKYSPFPLIADESVLSAPDMNRIEKQFHGINMKLMKAGGYLNGIRILKEARRRNLITMVGCMVETTLGISSAWSLCSEVNYADLDGCLIVKDEPFGLLKEENGTFTEA